MRLTVTDLGARLGVSPASVTRLVDGLVRDGWVKRLNVDDDKRVTHVQLVDSAAARIASLLPDVLNFWNDIWSGLDPDEKDSLTRIAMKLRAALLARFGPDAAIEKQEY
jgi:DNA-binding MarR family transcriptional regulator